MKIDLPYTKGVCGFALKTCALTLPCGLLLFLRALEGKADWLLALGLVFCMLTILVYAFTSLALLTNLLLGQLTLEEFLVSQVAILLCLLTGLGCFALLVPFF